MYRHHCQTALFVVSLLLVSPHAANAEFFDIFLEWSGPKMLGVLSYCKIDVRRDVSPVSDSTDGERSTVESGRWCYERSVFGFKRGENGLDNPRPFWLNAVSGVYTSVGHDDDPDNNRVWMATLEPMFEARSFFRRRGDEGRGFMLHHGVGVSYAFLAGDKFRRLNNVGVKVRPVSAVFELGDVVVQVAFNVRVYADGFTADQFGVGPRLEVADRPTEVIRGVTLDVEW